MVPLHKGKGREVIETTKTVFTVGLFCFLEGFLFAWFFFFPLESTLGKIIFLSKKKKAETKKKNKQKTNSVTTICYGIEFQRCRHTFGP